MKKKWIPSPDEFYIGYLAEAPGKTGSFISKVVIILGVVIVVVCVTLVTNQRKFSKGIFEFGKLTTVEGVVSLYPVPNIRIQQEGKTIMLLLVGFGKMGATQTIRTLEERTGKLLQEQFVRLQGTRIYDHGKEILQITLEDNPNTQVFPVPENFPHMATEKLGTKIYVGEIVDPKCYFGVMKPGEGKAHRSCAIRCIAGGIPPVFTIKNEKNDFAILTGENINEEILPLVGDPIQLEGEVIVMDDWKIMKVTMSEVRLLAKTRTKENFIVLENDMALCVNPTPKSPKGDLKKNNQ